MNSGLELCTSEAMVAVRQLVDKVADTAANVLLRGETGVGKELVARALHDGSSRASTSMHKVNCAALPRELLESELFGHQKGAFTGAYREKLGRFELAHRGTLFLDEIGELPLALQAKLLHVLQDGEFARVGDDRVRHADVRVIAATNVDLEAAMRSGRFREDLYYRLNVIAIRVPPLRERREEIPALVEHFTARFEREYGRRLEISRAALRALTVYPWPGNVRELENVLKRAAVLGQAGAIEEALASRGTAATSVPGVVPVRPIDTTVEALGLKTIARQAARDAERIAIRDMLERVHWNRTKAARLLQISYKALLYKIVECGLGKADEITDDVP
ncbi:MAG: sigma 54-interacting transcriptional regulator [Candidatus Rokubacteria bacterium]|nr:sigma 54-interacting transcriptional regulator [Candidatus Rokubacteria bacterium]